MAAPVVIWDLATQSPRISFFDPPVVTNGREFLSDGRLLMTSGVEKELKIPLPRGSALWITLYNFLQSFATA